MTYRNTLSSMRSVSRLCAIVLLQLVLVLAQQGKLRHEIGHLAQPTQACVKQPPMADALCRLCLAFGQLSSAATPQITELQLASELAFARVIYSAAAQVSRTALAPRSRGPPAS